MGREQFTTGVRSEPEDVTGSRAIGTIYQNTKNATLLIMVTSMLDYQDDLNLCVQAGYVEDVTPPTILQDAKGWNSTTIATRLEGNITLILVVPRGQYYKVENFVFGVGNSITLDTWTEVTL